MTMRFPIASLALVLAAALPLSVLAQDGEAALRLLRDAERQLASDQQDEAVRSFELLLERFAGTPEARQAILRMAEIQLLRGDENGAIGYLQGLIESFPDSREAAEAWVMRATIQRSRVRDFDELLSIRSELRRVPILFGRDRFPTLDARGEARVLGGEISLVMEDFETASADFLLAIEDEPISDYTDRAKLGLANAFMALGSWNAAVNALQELTLSPDPRIASAAMRSLGFAHRHRLLPSSGQPSWRSTRVMALNEPLLKKPARIAVSDDGRLLMLDEGAKRIFLFDPQGNPIDSQAFDQGRDVWFSSEDQPWISDSDSARPLVGGVRLVFGTSSNKEDNSTNILGGYVDSLGRAMIADRGHTALMVYGRDGRLLDTVAAREPLDVAGGLGRGSFHVLDRKSSQVIRVGADLGTLDRWDGGWKKPVAIAVDRTNNIYVLDAGQRVIEVLGENRSAIASVGPTLPGGLELRNPLDLAIDGQGRLYILDARDGVLVLE